MLDQCSKTLVEFADLAIAVAISNELLSQIIQTLDSWAIWSAPCWLSWASIGGQTQQLFETPTGRGRWWASDDIHHSKKLVDFHPVPQKKMFSAEKGQQPTFHCGHIVSKSAFCKHHLCKHQLGSSDWSSYSEVVLLYIRSSSRETCSDFHSVP